MSDSESELLEVIGSFNIKEKNKPLKQFRGIVLPRMDNNQSQSPSGHNQTAYAGLPSAPSHINIASVPSASANRSTELTKDEFQLYCSLIPEFNPESI